MPKKKQPETFSDKIKNWWESDTAKALATIIAVLLIPAAVITWNYASKQDINKILEGESVALEVTDTQGASNTNSDENLELGDIGEVSEYLEDESMNIANLAKEEEDVISDEIKGVGIYLEEKTIELKEDETNMSDESSKNGLFNELKQLFIVDQTNESIDLEDIENQFTLELDLNNTDDLDTNTVLESPDTDSEEITEDSDQADELTENSEDESFEEESKGGLLKAFGLYKIAQRLFNTNDDSVNQESDMDNVDSAEVQEEENSDRIFPKDLVGDKSDKMNKDDDQASSVEDTSKTVINSVKKLPNTDSNHKYTVQNGENVYDISLKLCGNDSFYLNNMNINYLKVGQVIEVYCE